MWTRQSPYSIGTERMLYLHYYCVISYSTCAAKEEGCGAYPFPLFIEHASGCFLILLPNPMDSAKGTRFFDQLYLFTSRWWTLIAIACDLLNHHLSSQDFVQTNRFNYYASRWPKRCTHWIIHLAYSLRQPGWKRLPSEAHCWNSHWLPMFPKVKKVLWRLIWTRNIRNISAIHISSESRSNQLFAG